LTNSSRKAVHCADAAAFRRPRLRGALIAALAAGYSHAVTVHETG
jgi:hypothetical protein